MPSHNHEQSGQTVEGYEGWEYNSNYPKDYVHKLANLENAALSNPSLHNSKTTFGNSIRYAGGSKSHNNIPPYIAVNMWVRVS